MLRDTPNGWSGFLAKVQAALARLRSAPKETPPPIVHEAGYEAGDDACDVMSASAPKGSARGKAQNCGPQSGPQKKTKKAHGQDEEQGR